jgi:hypothetical protein
LLCFLWQIKGAIMIRVLLGWLVLLGVAAEAVGQGPEYRLAPFSVEVTCPLGHPLIAGLRQPAKEIVDPLYARGFVLLGAGEPIVLCAIDWCEVRNGSYELWREELAKAAGTKRERVLVCCLHQHDAPVTDIGAEKLLAKVGLGGVMFSVEFEEKCVLRTAAAVKDCLGKAKKITHIGVGQGKVEKVASNRRVLLADNNITYNRGSSSGGNKDYREAPDGLIDPWLKTITFWNGDEAVLALHCYATHPMSYYGGGGVSADFVGMARGLMEKKHPSVFQIYVSGCSGDVTAGKYNDGSPANRPILAERIYQGMLSAWEDTKKYPLTQIDFRSTKLDLEYRKTAGYSEAELTRVVEDDKASAPKRILAAMGLSSLQRVKAKKPMDFPCVDFGKAKLVLFPGEAFVEYQLMAQKMAPDAFVMSVGYGECWPGYIPAGQGFADHFTDMWYWVAPGSEKRIEAGLKAILR